MERYITVRNYRISHTDIVRFWIIVSLALCCILITALSLEENADPLEAAITINVRPAGKKMRGVNLLSGGERALTAISLLFSLYLVKPSAYCILDELDAPLDDANIGRFVNLLKKFSEQTQFIVVTHNKRTMEAADILYGVTQQERGVSTIMSVKFEEAALQAA